MIKRLSTSALLALLLSLPATGHASQRYYTYDEFMAIAALTALPPHTHDIFWQVFSLCESTGPNSTVDSWATNPEGPSVGAGQIRVDVHVEIALRYDLYDLRQNLQAVAEIYDLQGYAAWSCYSALFR